jgi:2-polyprenyl-3-methyl-5-hydroxy-6-metoxy-1,4-benzoquinol methylase
MAFLGHLDSATKFSMNGWVHNDTLPNLSLHVDILINRRRVCTLLANSYRGDVEAAGYGNGRKAFWFNPFERLTLPENLVEVFVTGTDQLLHNGRQTIRNVSNQKDRSKAEVRWHGDEEDASLTWGSIMTGDTFFDVVEHFFRFSNDVSIVEIGPGYGRLLKTMLRRGYPFGTFYGLDLSASRTNKLDRQFGDDRIQFKTGDCSDFVFGRTFDIAIGSATLEHLFPSIQQTLQNLRSNITANGMLFMDFIMQDETLSLSKAYFEEESHGGAYIRVYSQRELEHFFDQAGFDIVAVQSIVLGRGSQGESIKRALVCATRRPSFSPTPDSFQTGTH